MFKNTEVGFLRQRFLVSVLLHGLNEVAQQHGKRLWSRRQLGEDNTAMVIRFVEKLESRTPPPLILPRPFFLIFCRRGKPKMKI
jgi:hypothetical protein